LTVEQKNKQLQTKKVLKVVNEKHELTLYELEFANVLVKQLKEQV